MIIGFDGKRAIENNTGLGNYSRLLVQVLANKYPDNQHLLYAPRLKDNPRMRPLLECRNIDLRLPANAAGRAIAPLWRSKGITRQLGDDAVELFHGLSGELPLNITDADIPSVLTIHDVIFRHFPRCYSAIDRHIYDYKFSRSAAAATRVIAISRKTKEDIMDYYSIPAEKIDVVYQGCHEQFHRQCTEAEIEAAKRKYGLSRPYIITVGTVETRKNQIMAVRGLAGLPDEFDLVIVGRRTDYARLIDKFIASKGLQSRVKFIEHAAFTDLPALYAGAFCSSYTSRFEGFGIPVIESLSAGTPVVVATGSCLEEAAGPDAPAVDPDDVEEWINSVKEIINYSDLRHKLVRKGREHIARFNDDNMASQTMDCYLKAIDEFKAR